METYKERVERFRIMRHDDLPEGHKAELRAHGIDPDDNWALIWSFADPVAAAYQLIDCIDNAEPWQTYRLVDNLQASIIERSMY